MRNRGFAFVGIFVVSRVPSVCVCYYLCKKTRTCMLALLCGFYVEVRRAEERSKLIGVCFKTISLFNISEEGIEVLRRGKEGSSVECTMSSSYSYSELMSFMDVFAAS